MHQYIHKYQKEQKYIDNIFVFSWGMLLLIPLIC